jgi:hypothetical protein
LKVEESQITVDESVGANVKRRVLRMILRDLYLLLILGGLLLINYIKALSRFMINYLLIPWLHMLFLFFIIVFDNSHLLLSLKQNLFLSQYNLSSCNFWEGKSNRLKIELGSTSRKIR